MEVDEGGGDGGHEDETEGRDVHGIRRKCKGKGGWLKQKRKCASVRYVHWSVGEKRRVRRMAKDVEQPLMKGEVGSSGEGEDSGGAEHN